jgi:hypothetical protein
MWIVAVSHIVHLAFMRAGLPQRRGDAAQSPLPQSGHLNGHGQPERGRRIVGRAPVV